MNTCDRLLRSRFNPCADRVEAIGKFLDGVLEPAAEGELTSHLETCRRCREYQLFLEAADRGFREDKTIRAVLPELTGGLPARIQEEMAEALKRNLSLWLTDVGRALMYHGGLITPFLLDSYKGKPLENAIERCGKLLNSLERFEAVSKEDLLHAQETRLLMSSFGDTGEEKAGDHARFFFERAHAFDRGNAVTYLYHGEIWILKGEAEAANNLLSEGVRFSRNGTLKSCFLNNIGQAHLLMDDLEAASDCFGRAKEEDFHDVVKPVPELNLALCRLRRKDASNAFHYFKNALKTFEGMPSIGLRECRLRFTKHFIAFYAHRYRDLVSDHPGFQELAESIGRIDP